MQHIIKTQVLDIKIRSKQDAFHVQHLAGSHYRKTIVPLLEEVFDEMANDEEAIRLDTLEIDLGSITIRNLEADHLPEAWREKLKEQVKMAITKAMSQPGVREPKVVNSCRQWLFFLQKGYVPWNRHPADNNWHQQVLEALATDFKAVEDLRGLIRSHPLSLKRLVAQHSADFLVKLAAILTAENQTRLPAVVEGLRELMVGMARQKLVPPFTEETQLESILWQQVLYAASHTPNLATEKLAARVIRFNVPRNEDLKKIRADFLKEHKTLSPEWAQLVEQIIRELPKAGTEDFIGSEGRNKTSAAANENKTTGAEAKEMPAKKGADENEVPLIPQEEHLSLWKTKEEKAQQEICYTIEEDGIFVQLAGLVLLHPFLSAFFGRLQLVEDKKFTALQTQQRALHLLYYLGTGNLMPEEYELVVPKILCAYPLAMPVEKEIVLTDNEREEADHLLQVVIQKWEILKSTSPDGLREGFLQRNGKLFTKNDLLYVQVESGTIDVLLDHLPWNISMIKLPWMKEVLRVEWR